MNRREFLASAVGAIGAGAVVANAEPEKPKKRIKRHGTEVGSIGGCFGKPVGFAISCDLSCMALEGAIAKFPADAELYLRVSEKGLDIAKRVVYSHAIARGMREPRLALAIDQTVDDPKMETFVRYSEDQRGWLVSDFLPVGIEPLVSEYIFPEHVTVTDGRIEEQLTPHRISRAELQRLMSIGISPPILSASLDNIASRVI